MKKNWLTENIAPIIAIAVVAFTFMVILMILTKTVTASEVIVTAIIGTLTNILMLIVGYYFGSSQGSKAKQQTIDEIKNPARELS